MSFTSPPFLALLFLTVCAYWALPARFRWVWLLAAGYLLYLSTGPAFFPTLLVVTLATYVGGRLLGARAASQGPDGKSAGDSGDARPKAARGRWHLGLSLVVAATPLVVFKYSGFVADTVASAARAAGAGPDLTAWLTPEHGWAQTLLLPIGISFYTFKGMSYLIEVARDPSRMERSLGRYALSISFFPQIFAGPIERPHTFLAKLEETRSFDREQASSGLGLLASGLFKKLVVADNLAAVVNQVYGDLSAHTGLPLLLALFGFSLQIYYDFSGYSDIANGMARLFGFDGVENFQRPYFARSFREFWHRWHISLSTWFRDYLYFPLGGSRVSRSRHVVNLMITFVVSGLWHGAAWTFAFWGALHGLFLVAESLGRPLAAKVPWRPATREFAPPRAAAGASGPVPRGDAEAFADGAAAPGPATSAPGRLLRGAAAGAGVFVMVSIAWVFFRAPSLADAIYVLSHAVSGIAAQLGSAEAFRAALAPTGLTMVSGGLLALSLAALLVFEALQELQRWPGIWSRRPTWQRHVLAYGVIAWILLAGSFEQNSFIYFQF